MALDRQALDQLHPPAVSDAGYTALAAAVISGVLKSYVPRDAASWLRSADGRFWAGVGGLNAEALAERVERTTLHA